MCCKFSNYFHCVSHSEKNFLGIASRQYYLLIASRSCRTAKIYLLRMIDYLLSPIRCIAIMPWCCSTDCVPLGWLEMDTETSLPEGS